MGRDYGANMEEGRRERSSRALKLKALKKLCTSPKKNIIPSGRTARRADEERNERLSEFALTRPSATLSQGGSQGERASAHKSFSLWEQVAEGRMRARTNAGSLAALVEE